MFRYNETQMLFSEERDCLMEIRCQDRLVVDHTDKLSSKSVEMIRVKGELELSHESIPRILLLLLGQLKWLHCCAPVQGGRRW
jgi:hypothetical protein